MWGMRFWSMSNGVQDVTVEPTDDGLARVTWPSGQSAEVSWQFVDEHAADSQRDDADYDNRWGW